MSASPLRIISLLIHRCTKCCKVLKTLYLDAPYVFVVVLAIILLVLFVGGTFSSALSQYIGSHAVVAVDLALFWLFARLVARVLLFPGSAKLFQRNTEATFRVEIARQYSGLLKELASFLRVASRSSDSLSRHASVEGVLRGIMVVEGLCATFRVQRDQEVKLTKDQKVIESQMEHVERWLKSAQVRRVSEPNRSGGYLPLLDWLRQEFDKQQHVVQHKMMMMGPHILHSVELVGDASTAESALASIGIVVELLDQQRHENLGCWKTTLRFFRVPTVGSLHQMRAELQMRFRGKHCWVKTKSGNKLDAMFIPAASSDDDDEAAGETAPLTAAASSRSFVGPTVIWCNPNAAYYETMIYQASWLEFWLDRGINIFFFNYSGYGRSTGLPSPGGIAEDGESIVQFLKGKGITEIAVYGRSIGGVTACHLANKFPEIKMLIADRTMSRLQLAAKHLYGSWAAAGLHLTRMTHTNVDNFCEARCYKVLIVDPKDTMILDMAALRTAVAERALQRLRPEERLDVDDDGLLRLAEVWNFFQTILTVCEGDYELNDGHGSARQPTFRHDGADGRGPSDFTGVGAQGAATALRPELVSAAWLEDNAALVKLTMSPLTDQLRSLLDSVGELIEAGGTSLNDALFDNPNDPCAALRCVLTNLQVWGSLPDMQGDYEPLGYRVAPPTAGVAAEPTDREVEIFLCKELDSDYLLSREVSTERRAELLRILTPETISIFHRRLARIKVSAARKELRRRASSLQSALACSSDLVGGAFGMFGEGGGGGGLGSSGGGGGSSSSLGGGSGSVGGGSSGEGNSEANVHEQAERLVRSVNANLAELENFVNMLCGFFKSVDLSMPFHKPQAQVIGERTDGDSSEERLERLTADSQPLPPQPSLDHSLCGYIMHVQCGHNGPLDTADHRQLALHLRAAKFGQPSCR